MVMTSLLGWFRPPELPQPEFRRRARALWMMSWPLLGVIAGTLAIAVIVEPTTLYRRATTVADVAALVLILHAISRSGRPHLASWGLVIGLSVIVTQRAWITGGIHAPVGVFYALFIVMAGILLGARGGLVTSVVCVGGAIVLAVGTSQHWLTPKPGAGSVPGAFVFVALTIGMAMLVQSLVAPRTRPKGLGHDGVQMLVHDMRSPMQVVLMHLEFLKTATSGQQRADVDGAIDGATTLSRMASSLLDASRLEAGRMPVRKVMTDLSSVSRTVVNAVKVLQPARLIDVESFGDVLCACDPELMRRIIENLVSNAMKHTDENQPVTVVLAGSDDHVSIMVMDGGPGLPEGRRASLFEPFGADGLLSRTGYDSSGLGLAFCRLAAEAQGGSIRYEERQPRGSIFIVDLPRDG